MIMDIQKKKFKKNFNRYKIEIDKCDHNKAAETNIVAVYIYVYIKQMLT